MKGKWWLILIAVLAVALVLVLTCWDALVMRFAPKTVLTGAISQTIHALEERFHGDPMGIFLKNIEGQGRYTADMELKTVHPLLGETAYNMTLQTDFSAHRFLAEGRAEASGKALNLSLYLDENFLAVSSADLLQGNYYGITYDTFGADIRAIPMLRFLTPEATLQEWENSLLSIRAKVCRDIYLPEPPEISREDVNKLLLGVLALPCKVQREEITINGEPLPCRKLIYSASGAMVSEILGYVLDTRNAADCAVSAEFYLYEKTLVRVNLSGEAGENRLLCALDLGREVVQNPLVLQFVRTENGISSEKIITVDTQRTSETIAQHWIFQKNGKKIPVAYRQDLLSGDMELTLENQPIHLNLRETDKGFRIETAEFGKFLSVLYPDDGAEKDISCTMTVRKGSDPKPPEYKNINAWSLDDFLVLLGGIGTFIGIKIG